MDEYVVALDSLFGCDRVNHGDPDEEFVWRLPGSAGAESDSEGEGCAVLAVPEGPARAPLRLSLADGSVRLMAQHVWQSALTLSEELAHGRVPVAGRCVLELGAGAALPGLLARRLGARSVVVSDYPEACIVANMEKNVAANQVPGVDCPAAVAAFGWGTDCAPLLAAEPSGCGAYDMLLLADTLWLEDQHRNLCSSLRDLAAASRRVHGDSRWRAVFTFMNHDNGKGVAHRFFQMAHKDFGLHVVEARTIAWKKNAKGEPDYESDSSNPERYGPVYMRVLAEGPLAAGEAATQPPIHPAVQPPAHGLAHEPARQPPILPAPALEPAPAPAPAPVAEGAAGRA